MKVYWTDAALEQLEAIYDYIAEDSLESANQIVDRLTKRSEQITLFPFSGRVVPEYKLEQVRELIEGSYRIIYYIKSDRVDVVAVIHGSRQLTLPEMN